uniref:Secreted protein n=1 Tax=Arundo donax TaxID=35708 RepID=A0A0A9GSU0_ARUDO
MLSSCLFTSLAIFCYFHQLCYSSRCFALSVVAAVRFSTHTFCCSHLAVHLLLLHLLCPWNHNGGSDPKKGQCTSWCIFWYPRIQVVHTLLPHLVLMEQINKNTLLSGAEGSMYMSYSCHILNKKAGTGVLVYISAFCI